MDGKDGEEKLGRVERGEANQDTFCEKRSCFQ